MKIPVYANSDTPTIIRLEGEVRKLNNKIRNLKMKHDIPWDDDDLIEGRCTLSEFRAQEVYVDI